MKTRIEKRGGITRYLQLYTVLAQALTDGVIDPGSALPSEPELVRRYKLSRTTVRRALSRLENEGRIVRRRGSGTFARTRPQPVRVRVLNGFRIQDLRTLAERTTVRTLQWERVPTPDFVRRQAEGFGDSVLLVRRVRNFDGQPFQITSSYVPERLAARLTPAALGAKTLLVFLHESGAKPAQGEQTTSAVAADAFAARHLRVAPGTPLLHIRRLICDPRGRPVEFQDLIARPEFCEYRSPIELE